MDYFLNESGRGYCVHYASAGVLMMRYFGVPARYVTGYLTKVPASGKVEVLDSDAHAWVEIYLDGYGWYPVEMTPPAEIGLAPGEGIGETAPEPEESVELDIDINEPEPETPEQKPQTETPEQPDQPTEEKPEQPEESAETDAGIPTWAPWTLVGILVLAIFHLHSWYCSRRRERQFSDSDYSRAVLAMYRHLEQLQPWGTDPTALQSLAQRHNTAARASQRKNSSRPPCFGCGSGKNWTDCPSCDGSGFAGFWAFCKCKKRSHGKLMTFRVIFFMQEGIPTM